MDQPMTNDEYLNSLKESIRLIENIDPMYKDSLYTALNKLEIGLRYNLEDWSNDGMATIESILNILEFRLLYGEKIEA